MENRIIQQIREGSLNFRMGIEGYLGSAETTFKKLNEDLRNVTSQVERKFLENGESNAKFDGALFEIIEQNRRTQKTWERERREREEERNEMNKRASALYNALGRQQNCLWGTNSRLEKM